MKTTRTPIATVSPVSLAAVKAHARIDFNDDDVGLDLMARVAATEIEAHTGIALLAQIVTVTMDAWEDVVELPVGPLWSAGLEDNPVTVEARDASGNVSSVTDFWMEAGRYPRLHLSADVEGIALVVTYPAGHGNTSGTIPADLQFAVIDQVASTYDARGLVDGPQGMSLAASRIAARNRRIKL